MHLQNKPLTGFCLYRPALCSGSAWFVLCLTILFLPFYSFAAPGPIPPPPFVITKTYNVAGNYIFTVPQGVTSITVEAWGGGGRGGSKNSGSDGTGGGGGGAYSRSIIATTSGQSFQISVGAGSASNSEHGGDSWVSPNGLAQSVVLAKGGKTVPANDTNGAQGGQANEGIGTFRYSGGNGANAPNSSSSGGGGSSAGTAQNGTNAAGTTGGIAPSGGGNGGNGRTFVASGIPGQSPGGGGGGAVRNGFGSPGGGTGGRGQVLITYTYAINAGDDLTQCENALFQLAAPIPPVGFSVQWSVISGTAYIFDANQIQTTVHIPQGSSAQIRLTVSDGSTTATDDVILTNQAGCASACSNQVNVNGNLELPGTANAYNLSFQGAQATLISNNENPDGWSSFYRNYTPNTSNFTGAYYINTNGSGGNPYSGSKMVYLGGNGFAVSAYESSQLVQCGRKFRITARVGAYSNNSSQSSSPFVLAYYANGSNVTDYLVTHVITAPASSGWNNINWQRYSFDIEIPSSGYQKGYVLFGSLSDVNGILIDDVCVEEIASGSVANGGDDIFNCSPQFTMAAVPAPANHQGFWSVISGNATISNTNIPNPQVTINSGNSARLRWNVNKTTAQNKVTLINPNGDGGFENGSSFSDNGWNVVNQYYNRWNMGGVADPSSGNNAAFISQYGWNNNNYFTTVSQTVHLYKDVKIHPDATNISLSFKWKGAGESGYDRLLVYTAPTGVTPSSGVPSSPSTNLSGATLVSSINLHSSYTYQTEIISLPNNLAGSTVRLIFTWQNDDQNGENPPAAFDEVSLTHNVPNCSSQDDVVIAYSGSTFEVTKDTICVGDTASLTASGCTNGQILWSTGSTSASIQVQPASTANYSVTCTPNQPTNSLLNPGFESDTDLQYWTQSYNPVVITTTANNVYEGTRAALLNGTNGISRLEQPLDVLPGEKYVFKIYAKTTNTNKNPHLRIRFYQSGWSAMLSETIQPVVSADYQEYTLSVIAPPNAAHMMVTAEVDGAILYIDNATLHKYTQCTAVATTEVFVRNLPNAPVTNSITQPTCYVPTGSVQFNGLPASGPWVITRTEGNVQYNGSGSSYTVTGLAPGSTYHFNITNQYGCTSSNTTSVNILPIPSDPVVSGDIQVCVGSQAYVLPSVNGTWSSSNNSIATVNNAGVVTGVSPGNVTLTYVRTSDGCDQTLTFDVFANPAIPFIGAVTQPTCIVPSGSVNLQNLPNSGNWTITRLPDNVTYNGSGANFTVSNIPPNGNYTFRVTDWHGCMSAVSANVNINPIPSNPVITGDSYVCESGTAQIYPSSLGNWVSSNTTIATVSSTGLVNGISPGMVNFTYTRSSDGCANSISMEVHAKPVKPVIDSITQPTCIIPSGTVHLQGLPVSGNWILTTFPGGDTIQNTGHEYSVPGLSPDSAFWFHVTDSLGCISDFSDTSSILPIPTNPVLSGDTVVCSGGLAQVYPDTDGVWISDNLSIASINNAGVVTGVAGGIVQFTYIRNVDGCESNWLFEVYDKPLPPSIGAITQPICYIPSGSVLLEDLPEQGSWTITATPGGMTYSGSGESYTVTGLNISTTYTFTVVDHHGCLSSTSANAVINAMPVNPVLSGDTLVCVGSTAQVFPSSSGSWASSNNSIATINASGIITGVSAGTVVLTYTRSSDGCQQSVNMPVFDIPSVPVIDQIIQPTCILPVGTVYVSGLPATGNYVITVQPGNITFNGSGATQTLHNLPPGQIYTLTVRDFRGCSSVNSTDINVLAIPSDPVITGVDYVCIGSSTVLSPTSGGVWTSQNTSVATITNAGEVTGLTASDVLLTFTRNADGCSSDILFTVRPLPLPPGVGDITQPTCIVPTGSVELIGLPEEGDWVISRNPGDTLYMNNGTSIVITDLTPGVVYTFSLVNQYNCLSQESADVVVQGIPSDPVLSGDLSACQDVNALVSPSTGGTWTSSNPAIATVNNSGVVQAISDGVVSLTYERTNDGCTSVVNFTVHPLPATSLMAPEVCQDSTLWISNNPNVGLPPFNYQWSGPNGYEDMVKDVIRTGGLVSMSGMYYVTITDGRGCIGKDSIIGTVNPRATLSVMITDVTTHNGSNGIINLTVTGGTGPFTYAWNNGATTQDLSGLTHGLYVVTVTDAKSCVVWNQPEYSVGHPADCDGFRTQTQGGWGSTARGNNPGSYRDNNFDAAFPDGLVIGCDNKLTLTSSAAVKNYIPCGGPTSLLPNGDLVDPSCLNNVFTGQLVALTLSATFDLYDPDFGASDENLINLRIASGPFYRTSVGQLLTEANNLIGGCGSSYSASQMVVALTNVNENYVDGKVTGDFVKCCQINLTTTGGTVCSGNTIPISANATNGIAPYTYQWSDGLGTGAVINVSPGATKTYSVTVTDDLGCTKIASVTVNVNPTPIVTISAPAVCAGTTLQLTSFVNSGTPTFTYNWTGPNGFTASSAVINRTNANVNMSGSYFVTVTDSRGCTANSSRVATVNPLPSSPLIGTVTQPLCVPPTGSIQLNGLPASGSWTVINNTTGATYSGSGTTLTVSNLAASTTYRFRVVDQNTCSSSLSTSATLGAIPADPEVGGNPSACVGVTTYVDPADNGTWTSSNPSVATVSNSGIVTAVNPGTVVLTYTRTSDGCDNTLNYTVFANPIAPVIESVTQPTCYVPTGTIQLSGLPSTSFWTVIRSPDQVRYQNTGSTLTIQGLPIESSFTFRVINENACASTVSATANINGMPANPLLNGPAEVCSGASATFTPETGGTWISSAPAVATINNSGQVTAISAGQVTFSYTRTSDGCGNNIAFQVNANPTQPIIGTITQPTCITPTGSVVISGLPASGTWTLTRLPDYVQYSGTGSSYTVSGLPPGQVYSFIVRDLKSCASVATTDVSISDIPSNPVLGGDNEICAGLSANVTPSSSGIWTSSNTSIATIQNNGQVAGIAAGIVILTYTRNVDGCQNAKPFQVRNNPQTPFVGTITAPTCITPTGSVNLQNLPSSGTWQLTILPSGMTVSGTGTNYQWTGLAPNSTFNFFVANSFACVSGTSANVSIGGIPTDPVLSGDEEVCAGLQAQVLPSTGGLWYSSDTNIATIDHSGLVTGISEGSIDLTYVRNADGCDQVMPFTVHGNPANPLIVNIIQPTCTTPTGSVEINGLPSSGPWSLVRSPGNIAIQGSGTSALVQNLPINTNYTFSLVDMFTCVSGTSSLVAIGDIPSDPVLGGDDEICTGFVANVTPGSSGTWSSSNTAIATIQNNGEVTGVAPGLVSLTYVRTSDGCDAQKNFSVHSSPITPFLGTVTHPTCYNPTGSVQLSGLPLDGMWTITTLPGNVQVSGIGDNHTISGLSPDTEYTFTVVSEQDCSSSVTGTVYILPIPSDPIISGDSIVCLNADVALSTGSIGNWQSLQSAIASVTNQGLVSGLTPGFAQLTFTRISDGCNATKIVEVKPLPDQPLASIENQPTCLSPFGSVNFSNLPESGNWTILRSPGNVTTTGTGNSFIINNIPPNNTYQFILTNQFGCQTVYPVEVVINPVPDNPILSGDNNVCFGESSQLSPSANGVWWSSEPAVISIDQNGYVSTLDAGAAIIRYTRNSDGCVGEMNFFSHPNPVATITGEPIICIGGATVLEANGGVIYNWSTGSSASSVVVNTSGLYGLTVTNSFGCVDSTNLFVTINSAMSVDIDYQGSVCITPGKEISANVAGGTPPYVYQWNGPGGMTAVTDTVVIGENGNYYLTVIDDVGCEASTQGFVYQEYDPLVAALQTTVCEGQSISLQINSASAIAYQWSENAGSATTAEVVVFPEFPSSTYTVTVTNDLGCTAEPQLVIDVLEKPEITLTGEFTLCIGDSTTFTANQAGNWASTNPFVAEIDQNGLVVSFNSGETQFIFSADGNNCPSDSSAVIIVYDLPEVVIDGPQLICVGQNTQMLPSGGGVWTSDSPGIANISSSGLVTGISAGSARFTYQDSITGCKSLPSEEIQVQSNLELVVTGPAEMCVENNIFLEANISGGIWSSLDTALASINNSGIVYGKSDGNVTISYQYQTAGCVYNTTHTITIHSKPVAIFDGDSTVCAGEAAIILPGSGGLWSSTNADIANIDHNGNIQTIQPGEVQFIFTNELTGCVSDPSGIFTVLANPVISLDGNNILCEGNELNLSSSTIGSWVSSDPMIASLDENGKVVGLSAGLAYISFVDSIGSCLVIEPIQISVVDKPTASLDYHGNNCLHDQSQISVNATGGQPGYSYEWYGPGAFTANTQHVFISTHGNYLVTVTDNNGCTANLSGYVFERFEPIVTGLSYEVCEGEEISLTAFSNQAISYAWSTNAGSSTQASVTVNPVVPSSLYSVTVTNDQGCVVVASANIQVHPTPLISLAGPDTLCVGDQTTLQPVTEGVWESLYPGVASISNNGLVTGLSDGISRFIYTNSVTGCVSDTSGIIFVNAPTSITQNPDGELCPGKTVQLLPQTGGVWHSSQSGIASVEENGLVTAISSGVTLLSFTNEAGCVSPTSVSYTVHHTPAITLNGDTQICVGTNTHFLPNTGGSWSSLQPAIAEITNAGMVTGLSEGSAQFVFTNAQTGCVSDVSQPVFVNDSLEITLTGQDKICVGSTTSFSPTSNGLWVSNQPSIASISPSGIVTGLQAGVVTFSFTSNTAQCFGGTTIPVEVFDIPSVSVQGPAQLCVGDSSLAVTNKTGLWTSSNPLVASIQPDGKIRAVSPGLAYFYFTDTITGCVSYPTGNITINEPPTVSIAGIATVCEGAQTTLLPSNGGNWISINPLTASVSSSGVVTGLQAGAAQFIFVEDGTGCVSEPTDTIFIESTPLATYTGQDVVCVGLTTQLSPISGGAWISSNPSVASINNLGVASGVSGGLVRFVFTSENGCSSEPSSWLTVNDKPQIVRIGTSSICVGTQTEYLPSGGGSWQSSNNNIGTINEQGIISGVNPGSVRFIYTDAASGCQSDSSEIVIVQTSPQIAINGTSQICTGQTTNLTPTSGGQWVSLNPAVADVNAQGVVNGLSGGSASFRFTNQTTGCSSEILNQITVNDRPTIMITGQNDVCVGNQTTLSPTSGGIWTALDPSVGSVTNAGIVTGLASGNARFRFTDSGTGCVSSQNLTVRILSAPVISINGPSVICTGATTSFLPSTGGYWTSTDTSIAIITNDGLVTGIGSGNVQFYFTNMAGCASGMSQVISVQPTPELTLVGPAEVCLGYTTQLYANTNGVWYSHDLQKATVTTAGKITALAPGKANFYFVDSESGCTTQFTQNLINIKNCIDPDVNVTLPSTIVNGNMATNDEVPNGTIYGSVPVLVSKPSGAFSSLQILPDGRYTFVGNLPGQYRYAVQVCLPGVSVNCPQFPLTIHVADPAKMEHSLVINTDLATTYKNGTVAIPILHNDGCISSTGCEIDPVLVQIPSQPEHGTAQFINDSIINYQPDINFIGSDTIIYQVCPSDNSLNCKWARMVVIVKDSTADHSISASDNFFTVNKNIWLQNANLISNDMSPEGLDLTIVPAGDAQNPLTVANGQYYINESGMLFFRANDNYVGPADVEYQVCDDSSYCVKATAHILILDNLKIKIRAYLEGGLVENGDARGPDNRPLMKDGLRFSAFTNETALPAFDPYSYPTTYFDISENFVHVGPGALPQYRNIPNPEQVFGVSGADAIVDWVFVELRNVADSSEILATRAGLIQRDGDVVDLDGVSHLDFPGLRVDSCYIVLRHRNHLDVMSRKVPTFVLVDFTLPTTPTFDFGTTLGDGYDYTGLGLKRDVVLGYMSMWAGDFDGNGKLKFNNPNDDQNLLFFEVLTYPNNLGFSANYNFGHGYFQGDIDMNGKIKYDNPNDDKNYLFYQILFHPLNGNFISNFNSIIEQVPQAR